MRGVLDKKGVMNEVIGAFVLLLVVAIIAGMTFLFLSKMQDQTADQEMTSFVVSNETLLSMDEVGESVVTADDYKFGSFVLGLVTNATDGVFIDSGNYTSTSAGFINVTAGGASMDEFNGTNWNASYTYASAEGSTAVQAVNDTAQAGTTIVDFLPILFLAIIFGAILTVILKVILPFINLGRQSGF